MTVGVVSRVYNHMGKSFNGRFLGLCWSTGMSVGDCLDRINYFGKTHFNYWPMIPRAGILDYVNGERVQSTALTSLSFWFLRASAA